jgi:hypothetical protein
MLTNKEIKEKAERSYKDFLLSVLRREVFFPCHIKGNKGNPNLPLKELYAALSNLIDNSKEKLGFGYTVTYKAVNTRHSGEITLPDEIFFENPVDFLKFIEKEADFLAFRKALDLTKRRTPSAIQWITDNPLKFQKYTSDWDGISTILQYFLQNPRPNCYWQQLPLPIDLVNLETHQALIGEILDTLLPISAINAKETRFEPRFGLRYDEPMVRIRWLDDKNMPFPNKDIAFLLSDFPELSVEKVFFITDKTVFLTFPNSDNSVAIYWEHPSNVVTNLPNLQQKIGCFFGDISAKGMEQLAEMRHYLPNLRNEMMNKTTFEAFSTHHDTVKHTPNTTFLHHLTKEEYDFYQFLVALPQNNALMQRKIPYSYFQHSREIHFPL